jgi:glucokinase
LADGNFGASLALGIDVGGTTTKGALVAGDGSVVERGEVPTDSAAGTRGIVAVAQQLLDRRAGHGIAGIGVGAAGFVDAATGCVTFSPNVKYDEPDIGAALQRITGAPVVVDNDANVAVWGERAFGAARGAGDVAMLTLGTGLGSGFVVGGRLLRGGTGAAGELGHTIVDPSGPRCPCGLSGCLEQSISGNAVARAGREAARGNPDSLMSELAGGVERISGRWVAEAAKRGDEAASSVLRSAGRALGVGMSNVVNIFDPEVIVIGGGLAQAGEPLLGPARDRMNAMLLAQGRRPQRLEIALLGNDAGVVGAAALALARTSDGGEGAVHA